MSRPVPHATLTVNDKKFSYVPISSVQDTYPEVDLSKLPFSQKILLENALRHREALDVIRALTRTHPQMVVMNFYPSRVLMQDFTGVPAFVDLASLRDAMIQKKKDASKINPSIPVDLVIDHSVTADYYGTSDAFSKNVAKEYHRNHERYRILHWAQRAFENVRVVPPGTGICHQVNLEYLAQVVFQKKTANGETLLYPDTLVGTDSHTPMVNGLSVLGWGVGGIEAEAAVLGQPLTMLIPEVVGLRLTGKLKEGVTATDLVLTLTNLLRAKGMVGKFVEFFGDGLDCLTLPDRATVANMAPEYGATCGFFPIDQETLDYLTFTGRSPSHVSIVEAYAKAQFLWRRPGVHPEFSDVIYVDLASIRPTIAGPKRPQDKILLEDAKSSFENFHHKPIQPYPVENESFTLSPGDIVIAAITSCTNTSNPTVLIGAGLLARKARALGLKPKPWVKTSLAPGSKVVTDYLKKANLLEDLEALGFYLVGYGCTTCIGNSGLLKESVGATIDAFDLTMAAVLSGNRNFDGRIHPQARADYLMSPPLVVAYAIAGSMMVDLTKDALGQDANGKPIFLKDIWPSDREIQEAIYHNVLPGMFTRQYAHVYDGDYLWNSLDTKDSLAYPWDEKSTYIKLPPYFSMADFNVEDIHGARILALLGDSITTDHISPAGAIPKNSPAGQYLIQNGVEVEDFNAYGTRRGNHEVMMRGTFGNIRLRNEMLDDVRGGFTRHFPSKDQMSIYDAAMAYQTTKTPLVIIAGKEYGSGSSRDWAAKGPRLLGVKAVIAESFERIHRANLVGMGILPLRFPRGVNRKTLGIKGEEIISLTGIEGMENELRPGMTLGLTIQGEQRNSAKIDLILDINTFEEINYFKAGGILPYVLMREMGSV